MKDADLEADEDMVKVEQKVEAAQQNRSDSPDQQPNQIVTLPMLLAAAAANVLEADLERLTAVPLLERISDDWRSREITDCTMVVLRLLVLKKVLHVDKIKLRELYPFLAGSAYSEHMVLVPDEGFRIAAESKQLSNSEFSQLLNDPDRQAFAYIGPGNYKSDSWVFLKLGTGEWLVLQFESKSRKPGSTVTAKAVSTEFSKVFKLPNRSLGISLYVTDQLPKDAVPEIERKGKKENFFLPPCHHDKFYGLAAFIKAMFRTQQTGMIGAEDEMADEDEDDPMDID